MSMLGARKKRERRLAGATWVFVPRPDGGFIFDCMCPVHGEPAINKKLEEEDGPRHHAR